MPVHRSPLVGRIGPHRMQSAALESVLCRRPGSRGTVPCSGLLALELTRRGRGEPSRRRRLSHHGSRSANRSQLPGHPQHALAQWSRGLAPDRSGQRRRAGGPGVGPRCWHRPRSGHRCSRLGQPIPQGRELLADRTARTFRIVTDRHRRAVAHWSPSRFHYLIRSSYRNSCRPAAISESWTSTGRSAASNTCAGHANYRHARRKHEPGRLLGVGIRATRSTTDRSSPSSPPCCPGAAFCRARRTGMTLRLTVTQ